MGNDFNRTKPSGLGINIIASKRDKEIADLLRPVRQTPQRRSIANNFSLRGGGGAVGGGGTAAYDDGDKSISVSGGYSPFGVNIDEVRLEKNIGKKTRFFGSYQPSGSLGNRGSKFNAGIKYNF